MIGVIILILILVLLCGNLCGKSSLARVGANGLIGAVAGPLAMLAGLLVVAEITAFRFKLHSRDMIATTDPRVVLSMMASMG